MGPTALAVWREGEEVAPVLVNEGEFAAATAELGSEAAPVTAAVKLARASDELP
jgi:hypothetical protein